MNRRAGGFFLLMFAFALCGLLLAAAGNGASPARAAPDEPYVLTLGGVSFDPLVAVPAAPAGLDRIAVAGPDLHLVQLTGPTQEAWLDGLRGRDLEIVQYIHPFTYVVWGEAADLALNDAGYVRWSGPFLPAYRLLPAFRTSDAAPGRVNVLLYRGADLDGAVAALVGLGAEPAGRRILNDTWEIAAFSAPGALLAEMAGVPGVYSIQPLKTDGGLRGEMSNQINVNNHDGTNLAFTGYADWLSAAGVDGAGVVIANVDGGIDQNHPDLVNRVLPCSGTTCGGSTVDSHGTHTAGIMAADGASGTVDSRGFLRGQGMAPGAELVEQLYWPYYTQAGGMLLLMTESYNNGASLSGNSWGPSGFPQGYDDDTLQVDIGVRDADPVAAGNQSLTYVLSFMNGYGGVSSQGSPDEGKNIFTIGSTKMQTSTGVQILDINDLSGNSAHGPALDGRTIPHMVAPGCRVDSTVLGNGYDESCGTSMASPHVSGAVALFIEYYRALNGSDPSPALVKAAFLPVAHDLAGFDDADGNTMGHPFDNKQGWGRMDTAVVVSPTVPVYYYDQQTVLDATGEQWEIGLKVADPTRPAKVMLVWTDAPGHGLGGSTPAWNNDLDLEVDYVGATYVGNDFGGDGWSVAGGAADGMNNTEGVFLGPTASGALVVRVKAANINSDGVPGAGDGTDQDFALVCYNCRLGTAPDQLTLSKSASVDEITAGGVFTYTLSRQMSMSGVHTYTETLLDLVPAPLTVLTDTILLDGAPRPDLYVPASHAISTTLSGTFTDTHGYVVAFQVVVDEDIAEIAIENSVEIMLSIDGDTPVGPYTSTSTVDVVRLTYLPLLRRD